MHARTHQPPTKLILKPETNIEKKKYMLRTDLRTLAKKVLLQRNRAAKILAANTMRLTQFKSVVR